MAMCAEHDLETLIAKPLFLNESISFHFEIVQFIHSISKVIIIPFKLMSDANILRCYSIKSLVSMAKAQSPMGNSLNMRCEKGSGWQEYTKYLGV